MTRRETGLATLAILGVLLAALGGLALRWRNAHQAVADERERHGRTLTELQDLRAACRRTRRPDLARVAQANLISQVGAALCEAQIPGGTKTLKSLQTRDSEIPGSALRLQTATLQLEDLSPGDLGEWLAAWRRRERGFRITECELIRRHGAPAGTADGNRYDVRLVMSTPFWEETPCNSTGP
jgi:hypothetical protein